MIERSENAASRWTGLWDAVGTTVTKGERIRKRALPAMLGAAARKIGMAYGRGGARARALSCGANSSCSGHSNDKANSLRHSGMCPECRNLSGSCMPSPVQEEFKPQCKASLTHTRDGGAAVAQHDGHERVREPCRGGTPEASNG